MPAPADSLEGETYRVYTRDGQPTTLNALLLSLRGTDLVFLGETHDDPVAHHIEEIVLRQAHERYGGTDSTAGRPIAVSLEMFERDVQYVMDEYLQGLISESHFRKSSRPWGNYEPDYRPMVEFAKDNGLAVIAANAPRRYVNRVSRAGPEGLMALSAQAKATLPPLPYAAASEAYTAKWDSLNAVMVAQMGGGDAHGQASQPPNARRQRLMNNMLHAQSLWDAGMAYSITEHLLRRPNALVLHVTGSFHVDKGSGIPDHLERYRPGTRTLIVTMRPHSNIDDFDKEQFTNVGDFVILTDAALPRSYESSF
ncbi:MAG: ChaN family lipoprotein [Bacteroidota bacterium]